MIYGLGTAAVQMGGSIFGGTLNNHFARLREQEARQENYEYNEMAANSADARTRALYSDLYSPSAQIKQIKDAGLSPSIFYGDTAGISGQTGAQGTGATGISPTTYGMSPVDLANINLMNAQAEKVKAETETEKGENALGNATINELLTRADLNEAAKQVNDAETALKRGQTEYFSQLTWKVFYETLDTQLDYKFDKETYDLKKQQYCNEAALQLARIANLEKNTQLQDNQINEIENKIAQMWEQISVDWSNALANGKNADAYYEFIQAKMPYIEKEFEIEGERLKLENRKLWVNTGKDVFVGILNFAEAGMMLKGEGMKQVQPMNKTTSTKYYNSKGKVTMSQEKYEHKF